MKFEILEGFALLDLFATSAEDFILGTQSVQSSQSGLNHVSMIAGAKGFADDVFDADRFEHRASTATSDDASTRSCRLQHDVPATMFTNDFVGDGVVVEMNEVHLLARSFGGFLDGICHFVSLAKAPADATILVARDNKGAEAETTATFDDLGASVDVDDFFDGVATGIAISGVADFFCHKTRCGGGGLELQALFAGGVSKGFDLAMVEEATTIEDDFFNLSGQGTLGDSLSDFSRTGDVSLAAAETFLFRGDGNDCAASIIVDELSIDVGVGKIDSQTWTGCRAFDLLANARVNARADEFAVDCSHVLGVVW